MTDVRAGRAGKGLLGVVAVILFACAFGAAAQSWPEKPVRVIVPYPAGGFYDTIARLLAPRMQEEFGQPFIVENRVGAGGIVGAEHVAKAAPDGHTIMVGGVGPHGINPGLYPKLPYDAVRDFAPIVHVVTAPNVLVVHPSVPASNVQELIALAKAKPGTLNYASNGVGTSPHLAAELFAISLGIKLVHIPYKGSAPAVTAMLGGQTHLAFNNAGDILQHVRAGKLRALAVTGARRLPALPELPTMQEVGVPEYEAVAWWAYFAPAGTPRDVIARLNANINKSLKDRTIHERLSVGGSAEVVGGSPEDLAAFMKREIARWTRVVKEGGITPN